MTAKKKPEREARRMILFRNMVGYYSRKEGPPDYDPPIPCNCPACGKPWTREDVRTISVKWMNSDPTLRPLSLFYRVHKACDDSMTATEKTGLDEQALLIGDRVARALKEQQGKPS